MAGFVRSDQADAFLRALTQGRDVFALEQEGDQLHLVAAAEWTAGRHTLGAYRPVEPLKALVFRPREAVDAVPGDTDSEVIRDRIVVGAKGCDVSALRIHDYVFLETEPVDPFYAAAREKTIVVSCDCTDARDVCFCPAVNEQPYATEGFDINLSPVADGFVVESGSDRGAELLEQVAGQMTEADDAVLQQRDAARAEMKERVSKLAAEKGLTAGLDLQKAIAGAAESELWEDFAADCVECGACNFICCTCHCFLLADGATQEGGTSRVKKWDSCLFKNFARVAGGANPRGHRAERLFNRFDKKFNFFPQVLGRYACDGCGRCAEGCTGKIDIREVLKRAVDES